MEINVWQVFYHEPPERIQIELLQAHDCLPYMLNSRSLKDIGYHELYYTTTNHWISAESSTKIRPKICTMTTE